MLADGGTYDGEHEDEGGSRSQCIRADFSNIGKLTSDRLAWCNAIHGDSASAGERWALQLLFNASAPPHVLLAQSTICKEGIDLHRQCRHVIHYDFEWGAGAMEQREGRVDRVNSQWEREYRNWREQRVGEPPRIEVFALRLDGHYDDRRWSRVRRRQTELAAGMGASIVSDSDSDVKDLKPFDDPSVIEELLPDFRHPSGFPKAPRPLAGARLATGKGDSGQGG